MREIPSLCILALRAVGPPACNPEVTFGGPRAARKRPPDGSSSDSDNDDEGNNPTPTDNTKEQGKEEKEASASLPPPELTVTSRLLRSLRTSTETQRPYDGPGRPNANDVDISHPWIMAAFPPREPNNNAPLLVSEETEAVAADTSTSQKEFLAIDHSNKAVECLQLFLDALMESGRAGDSRLGVHFFREWVAAVTGEVPAPVVKKKDRSAKRQKLVVDESVPLGSLSLHNFAAGSIHTFRSMEKANVGTCLGTLDISGVHGLTDSILANVICSGSFPRLRRLSLKNCRKLTGKGIAALANLPQLRALDVGGCFNVQASDVVSLVQSHPATKSRELTEIYASGLGWTDVALEELINAAAGHLKGLGVGFSPYISGPGLILALTKVAKTLDRLAVPFVPGVDDAIASALGKAVPKLAVLDMRGCNKVYSLSGMMEGRAAVAGGSPLGHLFVLGRYSGISNNSLADTVKVYNASALTCVLDGGGTGGGIRR